MPTFKASNGKWLTIVADDAAGADEGGPEVTASRPDDPDTSPNRWEKGQSPEWLIDRDGATLWPWR